MFSSLKHSGQPLYYGDFGEGVIQTTKSEEREMATLSYIRVADITKRLLLQKLPRHLLNLTTKIQLIVDKEQLKFFLLQSMLCR